MRGFFSLEAAKEAMGIVVPIEETIREAEKTAIAESPDASFHHIPVETDTLWHKTDHLLYLPILNLTRPRDLYYYQGKGLQALYGFTYKYLTMEHFLGQLTRLKIGYPLANRLANVYAQSQYPGEEPIAIPSTGSGQASPIGMSSRIGRKKRATLVISQCGDVQCPAQNN